MITFKKKLIEVSQKVTNERLGLPVFPEVVILIVALDWWWNMTMPPLNNKIVYGLESEQHNCKELTNKNQIYDEPFVKCKRLVLKPQLSMLHVFSHFSLGILEIT